VPIPASEAAADLTDSAFLDLIRAQRRPMRRIVKRLSRGWDADDVESELLLRAWRHRERLLELDGDDLCRWSWAHGDYAARDVRRKAPPLGVVGQVPEHLAVLPDIAEERESADSAARLLAVLDPESRAIVVACAVEGATFAVIAERLNISEDNARQRYRRACARIRLHESARRAGGLLLLPVRACLPTRRARVFGLPWAPGALSSVMLGVLVLGVVEPPRCPGSGPAQTLTAADPDGRLTTPYDNPRRSSGTTAAALTAERGFPAPVVTQPSRPGHPAPATLPRAAVKGCLNDYCASTGDEGGDDPGDDLYVNLPEPLGRKNVKQNVVPACDVVPTRIGPAGCDRHT
jgi:RNA polymerase sigma factor (sigma-70 family)